MSSVNIARNLKQAAFRSLKTAGLFRLALNSAWRQKKLLILTYHGIAIEDEHQWNPELFMHPDMFRERLQIIKKSNCAVLPLGEAVERLYKNTLPRKCVVLTFDDGYYDFFKLARPIIKEFGFPVTLYLTTFYSQYNRPVFEYVSSYLLWKGRERSLNLNSITGQKIELTLGDDAGRRRAFDLISEYASRENLTADEKDRLAICIAENLGVDYQHLVENRILHLVTPDEVKQLANDGVDVQLHTHNHATPLDHELFKREIDDNRTIIEEQTGVKATHFCYPVGVYSDVFLPALNEEGIVSATTCDPGLATSSTHSMFLPRFVDTSLNSTVGFEGWLSGIADLFPHRRSYSPYKASKM